MNINTLNGGNACLEVPTHLCLQIIIQLLYIEMVYILYDHLI